MRAVQVLSCLLASLAWVHGFVIPSRSRVSEPSSCTRAQVVMTVEKEGVTRSVALRSAVGVAGLVWAGVPSLASAKAVKRLKNAPIVKLDSGVSYQEMSIGEGATPHVGDRVAVHYSLYYNGLEIESSRESIGVAATPFGFNYGTEKGAGSMVKGVQMGMAGMQVGGRRKITVPPELAFGNRGVPPFIPADATVLFDVSIWSIKPAGTNPNLTLQGSQNYF